MHDGIFRAGDLVRVTDPRLVECIGGPLDGELRAIAENGRHRDGCYVIVNDERHRPTARRWVPDEDWTA